MKTMQEIQQHLDTTVNTLLGQHGGRIDVMGIDNHPDIESIRYVQVKMSGGCRGCAGARATLRSIVNDAVMSFDGTIVEVVDITDHSDKTEAFFKE